MPSQSYSSSNSQTSPPRLSLVNALAVTGLLAAIRALLYLIAAPHYGYFRDELYYLACGEHPAWGYMDQPPLIGWMAWLLEHTIGTSLYALRLLPMLADAATIMLAGLLARKLGGGRWAVLLASLAVLTAPISLAFSHLFTMNAFDPLLWLALAWLFVRLIESGEQKLWLWIGALVGLALLNKYGVIFLLPGLLLGVALSSLRRSFVRPWFWGGAALATVIALPNFLWQMHWGFPFVQLVRSVRNGRDVMLAPPAYLAQQAQMIGYLPALLVIAALVYLFSAKGRRYALLALGFVSVLGLMLALKGKFYYVAPVYPIAFAAGAVGLERWTQRRWLKWFCPAYALLIFVAGAILSPLAIPLLTEQSYIAYTHTLGIQQPKFEHQPESELPQIYSDMEGWEERVKIVAAYFRTLSPEEQNITAIGAPNYGEAGAIDHFGPALGLPKAISAANNYWIWGPRGYTGESILLLDEDSPKKYEQMCKSFTVVARPSDPYSRPDENYPIYHCRGLKPNLQELWPGMKPWR
ncbi:MAG TPA: glycosyltransferase family 39 protein [Acidobacteriaceae bacterium]|nr:glycosyltransferase family 39 protein [Acidobacteriaceae bacterium]